MELNDIQLSLLKTAPGARWTPACEIRSQNVLTGFRYAKDYDAVVTVHREDGEWSFALEYERSAKAKRDYLAVSHLLDEERRISHVLYLVPNYDVLTYLTGILRPAAVSVWFGIVRDWHAQLLGMPVVDCLSRVPRPLHEALQNEPSSCGRS